MLRYIFAILVALHLASCAGVPSRAHYVDYESGGAEQDGFDWQNQGPAELLALLQASAKATREPRSPFGFRVRGVHYGWVQAEDLPYLISLLGSEEPCAPVAMGVSSWRDNELSTVGHEAAYLIEGFRKGRYPHALNSPKWDFTDDMERYRFEQWCKRFMQAYTKITSDMPNNSFKPSPLRGLGPTGSASGGPA